MPRRALQSVLHMDFSIRTPLIGPLFISVNISNIYGIPVCEPICFILSLIIFTQTPVQWVSSLAYVSVSHAKVSFSLSKVFPLPRAPFVVLLPLHTPCEVELMFDCGRLVDGKCSYSLCMTSMLLLISQSQPSRGNDFVHYVCLMKLSH